MSRTDRIGSHGRGSYWAVLSAYLGGAFVLTLALLALLLHGARRFLDRALVRFDEGVLTSLSEIRTPLLDRVALDVTALANTLTLVVLVLVIFLFLRETRHRTVSALLLLAVLGGALVNRALKHFFDRPRPEVVEWTTQVSSPSFPSGHAMAATVAYGAVAYVLSRLDRRTWARVATWSVACLLIAAVAASRVYLGVHYPSDVAGGVIAGAVWVAAVAAGVEAARRSVGD